MDREKIKLIALRNPLRREDKDTRLLEYKPGVSLLDLRQEYIPADVDVAVSVDGAVIPCDRCAMTYPQPGSCVVITPVLQGGDGKSIISMVLMIALAVAAPYIVGAMPVAWGLVTATGSLTMLGAFAAAGIAMVGGLLITALMPRPKPKLPALEDGFDTTQTYTWSPQTTQQQGTCVPRPYGRTKAYGNIIASYVENINDKQYMNVLICLGIGPVSALSDFKINDQPLSNFTGVTVETRLGHLDQDGISNFDDTKTEYPLAMKVVKDTPALYTTQGNSFQGLEVDVVFPQGLWYANDKGGMDGYSVSFAIEVQNADVPDSPWVMITTQAIDREEISGERWSAGYWIYNEQTDWVELEVGDGNYESHYEGEYYPNSEHARAIWRWLEGVTEVVSETVNYVTVTAHSTQQLRRTYKAHNLTPAHYNVRVSNLTTDQTDSRYGDDLFLSSVREVFTDDFEYPRHVLVGVKALATDQLSGSLRFSCIIGGVYVRVWDGADWATAESDDPAWVCYDILTQPVYDNDLGVLEYRSLDPLTRLNHIKYKAWSDYNQELVPDGAGGLEPRVTFNGVYDVETSLWEAALKTGQVGRATLVWHGAKLEPVVDKPAQPGQLFNITNMGIGAYEEVYLPMEERAAELELDFVNAADDFKRTTFNVFNSAIATKNNKINLQLFGCTKASEAWRHGRYSLKKNELILTGVTLNVALDALGSTVGDVVYIQHDAITPDTTVGGRVVSATANTVTLDTEVEIKDGKAYAIIVRLASDTIMTERAVITGPGKYKTVTVATPFLETPQEYDIFSFGEAMKITKPYRILNIKKSIEKGFTLYLVTYNGNVYLVDTGEPEAPPPRETVGKAKIAGMNCAEEMERVGGGAILNKVIVKWLAKQYYSEAKITVLLDGVVVYKGHTEGTEYWFYGELGRQYTIDVIPRNRLGQRGKKETILYTPNLQNLPPANVVGLVSEVTGDTLRLRWTENGEIDLSHYLVLISRGSQSHAFARKVVYSTAADFTLRKGNYKARVFAVDFLGNRSLQPAEATIKIAEIAQKNVIVTLGADPGTPGGGDYSNTACHVGASGLRRPSLKGTAVPNPPPITDAASQYCRNYAANFTDITVSQIDYPVSWFSGMDFSGDATWEGNVYDMGSVKEGYLSYDYDVTVVNNNDMTTWPAAISELEGIKVGDYADEHGQVEVSAFVSNNNVDWREVASGWVKARYIKHKVLIRCKNPTKEYSVNNIVMTLDVPDTTDAGTSSVTNTQTVSFNKTFNAVRSVAATASGGVCTVDNISATGFDVTVTGTKNVSWIAQGY